MLTEINMIEEFQANLELIREVSWLTIMCRNDRVGLDDEFSFTPVLYTVALYSPSVLYTHDFRPKNREW